MTAKHLVLIVEDEPEIAGELEKITLALNCEPLVIDNQEQAFAAIKERRVCLVLLDLNIKFSPDNMAGHVEAGRNLLRDIRRVHPELVGRCHRLPVLVISGNTGEVEIAVDVMDDDGADRVIRKMMFKSDEVSEHMRRLLERSGRATHEMCGQTVVLPPPGVGERITLTIPGDRVRRTTRVFLGAKGALLPNRCLVVLLELVAAKLSDPVNCSVHKTDLGGSEDKGFKGVADLRKELRVATGEGVDVIVNGHDGTYRLVDEIDIGRIDTAALIAIGDTDITDVAERIANLQQTGATESTPKV